MRAGVVPTVCGLVPHFRSGLPHSVVIREDDYAWDGVCRLPNIAI